MNDWREEKIKGYFHDIMEDILWYSDKDEKYILTRLIEKMSTEIITIIKEEEENDDE